MTINCSLFKLDLEEQQNVNTHNMYAHNVNQNSKIIELVLKFTYTGPHVRSTKIYQKILDKTV